ncbi:MAG TPA: hypothetical protein VG848_07375 [Acetobacteraceae bacterium]|jgi:hypothetical protein|nr:hypothetical protein [Acetobacteraceae bacterium]
MKHLHSLDALVRHRLRSWPQRPPGLIPRTREREGWLRARPGPESETCHPFLKFPGSNRLRTLPDGLWLHFGGVPVEPFVDIFAIEACGSLQNLLDKRSRFAPSTNSLLAVCPLPWLLAPALPDDPTPRWRLTGVVLAPPVVPLVLPVRDVRVMYGLKQRHYNGFAKSQIPHPHEYFVPMEALLAEDAVQNPAMQALFSRASANANFLNAI